MQWCAGTVIKVSNGRNLKQGTRHCRKDKDVEFLCEGSNEEISTSAIEIKKYVFNSYVEHSWRVIFDVLWSNTPLQSTCDTKEKETRRN